MADFPLPDLISQSSSRKREYRTLTAQFGDGYQQDAPDGINFIVDTWSMRIENLTDTDANTLRTFLDSVGSYTSWNWQAPNDSVTKTWKVTKDGWSESINSGNISSFSFTIKQVN